MYFGEVLIMDGRYKIRCVAGTRAECLDGLKAAWAKSDDREWHQSFKEALDDGGFIVYAKAGKAWTD